MTIALPLRDSIARRYALTVVLTVVVTWSLAGLFNAFGGVWALPSLEDSGLLDQAANMVRIIEAAPPAIREQLASAATTPTIRVGWYAATSAVSTVLGQVIDQVPKRSREVETRLGDRPRTVRILQPDGSSDALMSTPEFQEERTKYPHAYVLAVQYSDGSWLVFTVPEKLWGLSWLKRWAIWLLFLTVSTGIVSTIATRQLVRPIRRFAKAIRLFGTNPQAPPIAETGPRELKGVISAFNAMQAQIQKFVAYRTAMLAAISHDLRTPLTRMRLRGDFIADEVQQARLFRDVDELQAMVDGALAFFRGDSDEEAMTSFNLSGVLRSGNSNRLCRASARGVSRSPVCAETSLDQLDRERRQIWHAPDDRADLSGKDLHDHGQGSGVGHSGRSSGARVQPLLPARNLAQPLDRRGWPRPDRGAGDRPGAWRRYSPVKPVCRRIGSIGHAAADCLVRPCRRRPTASGTRAPDDGSRFVSLGG